MNTLSKNSDVGYRHCACRDCMEIAIGERGALCHDCEEHGCSPEGDQECCVPPCVDDDEEVVMGEGLLGGVVVRFRGCQHHFKTKDEAVAWVESQLKPKHPTRPCPNCGAVMSSLLFMGEQPDGFVCPRCKLYVSPQGVLLGTVIS